ncbi:DUF1206 domain-containing protein [Pontibacillus sp. ALD_SL1]|uniref:DUF1206 domain-containing protein n=1 Tax=Pontibacillus sp. ALD_SL1 TaxID=2777185 RepID=UPI001F614FFA|nr:DUF1206 domain-containing protein [Pontibacillus sp. ALD_SL1]
MAGAMNDAKRAAKRTEQKADQASQDVKPWLRGFARFGYTAKGAVYVLLGILSLMAALGVSGGKTTGTKGALATIASKPYGNVILWITAVGLIGYVMWRIIQVVKDPEHKGKDGSGIGMRIAYLISGIIYGALAYKAISLASSSLGSSGGSSGNSKQSFIAKVLSQPAGQWIIGAVGVVIIGYGLYEMYKGMTEKFKKEFKFGEMNQGEKKLVRRSGKFGLLARGGVMLIIGYFFIQMAMTASSQQANGLDAALSELASQPYGKWLLGIVSIGLALFGIFQILKGKNRHLKIS